MIEHEGDYCTQCGALLPRDHEVCSGCGAQPHVTTDETPEQ